MRYLIRVVTDDAANPIYRPAIVVVATANDFILCHWIPRSLQYGGERGVIELPSELTEQLGILVLVGCCTERNSEYMRIDDGVRRTLRDR